MDSDFPQSIGVTEPRFRCRAKGIVVWPTCQGTSDIRNDSYVVVDRCHDCITAIRGFITCPSCLGEKVVEVDQLRRIYRPERERERMRSVPGHWRYENPTLLSFLAPSATEEMGAEAPHR